MSPRTATPRPAAIDAVLTGVPATVSISAPNPTDRAAMTDGPRPARHIAGLDGLRAIAVIAVILFHLGPNVLPGGFLGVDVFFVISGFIITTLLLREKENTGRIRLGAFWNRRARRLLPALVLLILVCGSAALVIGGDVLVRLGTQIVGALTFSSNWIFIAQGSSYFDQTSPELFRNLWSLAVEEQFYLVWPFLVLLLVALPRRFRAPIVLALAAASLLAMTIVAPLTDPTRAYYGTDTHSFGLALGAVLAIVARRWPVDRIDWSPWRRRLLGLVGLAAIGGIVALSFLMTEDSPLVFAGGLGLVAVLTVLAIEGAMVPGSALGRALDLPPIRWVGVRSYGLYLWHWPVWVLVTAALPTWPRDGVSGWALGGIALAITVVASALSYTFVETPIRRDGFRRSWRLALGWWRYGTGSAVAATLAAVLVIGGGVATGIAVARDPGATETQLQVEAGQQAIEDSATPAPSASPDLAQPTPSPSPTAPPPEPVGGDQVLVIGDSVTLAAATELQSQLPGIAIDAAVSRQMSGAPAMVQAYVAAGSLRPVLVLALGTNGPIDRSSLDQVRAMIGPDRELVVVNAQAPRGWTPGVNATLADFARQYRNVELANWHDAVAPFLGELNRDQVHFGPSGARIWTGALTAALQRLAELPPLRDARDYESIPRPV